MKNIAAAARITPTICNIFKRSLNSNLPAIRLMAIDDTETMGNITTALSKPAKYNMR